MERNCTTCAKNPGGIRPPQCTTYAQLHEHMVRLYKMCEGTGVAVKDCIRKHSGTVSHVRGEPIFDGKPEEYEIALAFVEGKPVFRGDALHDRAGNGFIVNKLQGDGTLEGRGTLWSVADLPEFCSWNPPRRTINIGDVEVPAPKFVGYSYEYAKDKFTVNVEYANKDDAEAFKDALKKEQP